MDFGERRLTLADSQLPPDNGSTLFEHADGPVDPIASWIGKAPHSWLRCSDLDAAWQAFNTHTEDVAESA